MRRKAHKTPYSIISELHSGDGDYKCLPYTPIHAPWHVVKSNNIKLKVSLYQCSMVMGSNNTPETAGEWSPFHMHLRLPTQGNI